MTESRALSVPPRPTLEDDQTPELAILWRRLWRYVKWVGAGLLALTFALVIGQGFLYYRMIADVHPLLGIVFVLALALLLGWLVGRPLVSYLRTPVAATPPDVVLDPAAPTKEALAERLKFDVRFLKALAKHPDLKHDKDAIRDSTHAGQKLISELKALAMPPNSAFARRVMEFEKEHIELRLKPLDEKAEKLIHAEAVNIGMATAMSLNGTVDAFIVLWRSANLIAKLSRIYFGRPNLRGSLLVLRDVAAIVVLSRALEDVTDMTGDLIGTVLGKMGGLVAGPVMDGAVNALMALKLGYLTKRRCRAYRGWGKTQVRSISAEALTRVQAEATSVITEILKACGGLTATAANAAERVMTGSKNTWGTIRSWLGGRTADAASGD